VGALLSSLLPNFVFTAIGPAVGHHGARQKPFLATFAFGGYFGRNFFSDLIDKGVDVI